MAQLLLVNPKRRKRKAAKKSASAPRRRRRKMTAKQAKYFAPKRKRRTSRARAAATTPARKVRRRRASRGLAGFARNTSGSVNPRAIVGPAVIGAAGALGLDVLYGYLPIPANLKAGTFAPLVKLGAVIGISMLASRFLPRQRALVKQAAGAAVTIGLTISSRRKCSNVCRPSRSVNTFPAWVNTWAIAPHFRRSVTFRRPNRSPTPTQTAMSGDTCRGAIQKIRTKFSDFVTSRYV